MGFIGKDISSGITRFQFYCSGMTVYPGNPLAGLINQAPTKDYFLL